MTDRPVLVVDGNNLLYRSYHGFVGSRRGAYVASGAPTFAVTGMVLTVVRRARQHSAGSLVFAFDPPGGCQARRDLVESYKQDRPEAPGDLISQLETSWRLLREAGFDTHRPEGWEADDVMATVAARSEGPVLLLTADRDAIQTVSSRVRVVLPEDGSVLGPEQVELKHGVPPELYPHVAAIRGEPGDGIPGVAGIGKVGALRLVQRFGTVEAVLAASDADIIEAAGRRALNSLRRDGTRALRALEAAKLRDDLDIRPVTDLADLDEGRIVDTFGRAGLKRAGESLAGLVARARAGG